MAGGLGSRIKSIAPDIPKPMIKIDGVPILEREILSLRDQNFNDFIITVSYKADKIIDYFKDGQKFGVKIKYFIEKQPLGNAGALFYLQEDLNGPFLLLNSDALYNIDFNRFVNFHYSCGGLVTILTHPNDHPFDSSIIVSDSNNCVIEWINKNEARPIWYKNRINAGIHIIDPRVLDNFISRNPFILNNDELVQKKIDLDSDILKPLCKTKKMFCYDSPEYVKDMGTPARYEAVCNDFKSGIVQRKSLLTKQKAVFLDRDGTINKHVGFLTNIDDFFLIEGVAEAIRIINSNGYLAIVVTNQPVIARGDLSMDELYVIHNKMETLLGEHGAYLDGIYICPHHPDKGYPGEIPELKIECECRKPNIGLLQKAATDFNIDLSSSWMVGDSEADIKAGRKAGCKTALIGKGSYGQDINVSSLLNWCNFKFRNKIE